MTTEAIEKPAIITTGQVEIDKKLGGGIPPGSLILIEGQSDSGKSVLTQQITWGCLRSGQKVSMLTTENTVRSLMKQMDSLNLGVLDYCLLGKLKVYPLKATRSKYGAENTLMALLKAVGHHPDFGLAIVDSMTSFITHAPMEDVIGFFEECKSLANRGLSIAVVAHPYAFSESLMVRISSMCDVHLRLSMENLGDKLMKILEVSKVRGAQQSTGNIVSFDIEPNWGMKIIPFGKAKA